MTRKRNMERFDVAHVTFLITDDPTAGVTFGLYALGNAPDDDLDHRRSEWRKNRLFSGHIEKGMASALHRLAAHISTLESRIEE